MLLVGSESANTCEVLDEISAGTYIDGAYRIQFLDWAMTPGTLDIDALGEFDEGDGSAVEVNATLTIDGTMYSYRMTGTPAVPGSVDVTGIDIGDTFEGFIDANDREDAAKGVNGGFNACYCEDVMSVTWPAPFTG